MRFVIACAKLRGRVQGAVAAGLLGSFALAGQASAQNCDWGHSVSVTISAGPAGFSEEARIDLSASDFPAAYTLTPEGDDVRVFLAGTETPVDFAVTAWDPVAEEATIYVRPPAIAPNGAVAVDILLGNTAVGSASNPPVVFPTDGVRLRSRFSTVDPTDSAGALAAFDAGTDISDAIYTTVTGLNNRAVGGSNGNFGWCVSAMLEVTNATAGNWTFRYGADFGYGGHLYVGDTELEAQWNDDLWWAGSYNRNTPPNDDVLEGSIGLAAGWHRFEALGFEGCCDGSVGFQARAPGGAYQDLSSTNFALRGSQCISPEVTVTNTSTFSCDSDLRASKSASVVDDPVGSADPFAVPGARVRYGIEVENRGIAIDDGSITITDILPAEIALVVSGPGAFQLVQGAFDSALTLDWGGPTDTGDGVSFSTDGMAFNYTPVPDGFGADDAVTHVRFDLTGRMAGAVATDYPSVTIVYDTLVD